MDYALESLGPERFQQMVVALAAREFPGIQCFPVGQADGGRDGFVAARGKHPAIAIQVKMSRSRLESKKVHKWFTDLVDGEAPKLRRLAEMNPQMEVLFCLSSEASAKLDSGVRDKALAYAHKVLHPMRVTNWWREDINRRLDGNHDVKWSYPDLLTGPDVIRAFFAGELSEQGGRRKRALKAYIATQFERESKVKFRQINLHNDLFELYVDLPISVIPRNKKRGSTQSIDQYQAIAALRAISEDGAPTPNDLTSMNTVPDDEFAFVHGYEESDVGAAASLLHRLGQLHLRRVVLEGAPGQGKSTVSQYVAQVHRLRFLDIKLPESATPMAEQTIPVRLPFKLDLSDYALWHSGQNPFSANPSDPINNWSPSLDAYIAAQVEADSGGSTFGVDDLHATIEARPCLFILDGLDEVAKIEQRQEVIQEIISAVRRFAHMNEAVQTVVTSRPAAFANSPTIPAEEFIYLSLGSLTAEGIERYLDRWTGAAELTPRETRQIQSTVAVKIREQHVRDLCRNPMQFAILLNVIQTRGASLPDQRTDLYSAYIELFMSREAEKSSIVRDNRELLVDIHQYVAWVMHTRAEGGEGDRMYEEDLKAELRAYLIREAQDVSIVDSLFMGMVERVVALVSRVQGTYEFEVQPLREYFVARFLYETAPYSPPGAARTGTKPDRMAAVSRNMYWLHAARFYAGCYSKGELGGLVDSLQELFDDPEFGFTSHPRALAGYLLADSVFSQDRRAAGRLVSTLLDEFGARHLLNEAAGDRSRPSLLPWDYGGIKVVNRCLELLRKHPRGAFASEICQLVTLVSQDAGKDANEYVDEHWLAEVGSIQAGSRAPWIWIGYRIGSFGRQLNAALPLVEEYLHSEAATDVDGDTIVAAQALSTVSKDSFLANNTIADFVLRHALDGSVFAIQRKARSAVQVFSALTDPSVYWQLRMSRDRSYFAHHVGRMWLRLEPESEVAVLSSADARVAGFCGWFIRELGTDPSAWTLDQDKWHALVEAGTAQWPDASVWWEIALQYASATWPRWSFGSVDDFFAADVPVTKRLHAARLRSGAHSWWDGVLRSATSRNERLFAVAVATNYCTPRTLAKVVGTLECLVEQFTPAEMMAAVGLSQRVRSSQSVRDIRDGSDIDNVLVGRLTAASVRVRSLLLGRSSPAFAAAVIRDGVESNFREGPVLSQLQTHAIELATTGAVRWSDVLPLFAACREIGLGLPLGYGLRYPRSSEKRDLIPIETARDIVRHAASYPIGIVAMAEEVCRDVALQSVRPVAEVAAEQGWFYAPE